VTTVAEVDRLVQDDDAVAARLWPSLGSKVRDAYLRDRDAWIGLRQEINKGTTPADDVLIARRSTFSGWARAFRTAPRHQHLGRRPSDKLRKGSPATQALAKTPASTSPGPGAAAPVRSTPVVPAERSSAGSGVAAAVVAGLAVTGLVIAAARRNRA
jgi:hypothetical protein